MANFFVSPSKVVLQALGVSPKGFDRCTLDDAGSNCAACGVEIKEGDPIDALVLPKSFTNRMDLAYMNSSWRCGDCAMVMTEAKFQQALATLVATPTAAYPLSKRTDRAWFFQNIERFAGQPLVIAVQISKSQHTIWRAPITLDVDMPLIQWGEDVERIRMPILRETARYVKEHLPEAKGKTPFYTDHKREGPLSGVLRFDLANLPYEQVQPLMRLSSMERWALGYLLDDMPAEPQPLSY